MISIIIPVYNVSEYLRECLDSVINQSFTDWEGILINDGSTDDSGSICDEFASRDKRFRVIHQSNQGIVAVRNLGLQEANGDYIAWVDSDDIVHPQWLETMYDISTLHDCDISVVSHVGFREIDEICLGLTDVKSAYKISQHDAIEQLYHYKLSATVWNKLYNRRIIKNTVFHTQKGEDWDFNLQLLLKVPHVYATETPLYFYRIREGSLTNAYDINFLIEDLITECDIYEHFMETSHEEEYIPIILHRIYRNLMNFKKDAVLQGKLNEHAHQIFNETIRRTYNDYKKCQEISKVTKTAFNFFYRHPRLYHLALKLKYNIIKNIHH